MPWNLDNNRPIYLQLVERIQMDIVSGVYHAGDKLPSVRELAADAGVNPNTVQRALAELEGTGLLHTQRTAGRFVTEDTAVIQSAKEDLARSRTREYLESMAQLGYDRQQVKALLEEWKEE